MNEQSTLLEWPERSTHFFVVQACRKTVLDSFDTHFQASVHFPRTSAKDNSQQNRNKFLGTPR